MLLFGVNIPDKPLTNIELTTYARELEIPHFKGVYMRDTLPPYPFNTESGIVIHPPKLVVTGCATIATRLMEFTLIHMERLLTVDIQRYLRTGREFHRGKELIQRNTDIVQAANTSVSGLLFVLKSLARGNQYPSYPNYMQHYGYPQGE